MNYFMEGASLTLPKFNGWLRVAKRQPAPKYILLWLEHITNPLGLGDKAPQLLK